jgi:type IV pilus assembly protein PilQ
MNGRPLMPSLLLTALLLPAAEVRAVEQVDLRVLRAPGALELVLDGMGPRPEIQKRATPEGWTFEVVTDRPGLLSGGARFLNLQEAGIDTVGLDGGDRSWRLQVNGRGLGSPLVSADGTSVRLRFAAQPVPRLTTGSYDLSTPGRVAQEPFVPPLRRRAVAPPGGDMAISTMVIRNRSYLNITGPPVTMTTRGAQARDVLMLLARAGRYGFVFDEDLSVEQGEPDGGIALTKTSTSSPAGNARKGSGLGDSPPVTASFRDEPYASAFNLILMNTGLQARLEGRTIVVGRRTLSRTLGSQVSRTYRINQIPPEQAADYLASLGAVVQKVELSKTAKSLSSSNDSGSSASNAKTNENTSSSSNATSATNTSTSTLVETIQRQKVVAYGGSQGPLKGLVGTIDKRLGTVTLIGDSYIVGLGESYLKQADLRPRQVAVSVKILNIVLGNDTTIDNSFAFRSPNVFLVNSNGQLVANFGNLKPPGARQAGLPSTYTALEGESPLVGSGAFQLPGGQQAFIDRPQQSTPWVGEPTRFPYPERSANQQGPYFRPGYGPYASPGQPGITEVDQEGKVTYAVPQNFQYPTNRLYDFVAAQIVSRNAKTLASPTLVVQEGEKSEVRSVESVITDVTTTSSVNGTTSSSTTRQDAGIILKVLVDKIDDNGFVTLLLNPVASIPSPAGSVLVGSERLPIFNIISRSLESGKVRMRDGQTLILTGVITDSDVADVSKWPVLGDLPFFGQFFSRSSVNRTKQELVIVVTPRIVDDEQGGGYGYGYEPASQDARQMIYPR